MKEHGWEKDDWPKIYEKVKKANILVISSPIWLGEKSSVCTKIIERLYSTSSDLNEAGTVRLLRARGRMPHHWQRGRGQALLDEHTVLLTAPGYAIPPQADAGWIGEAGPGPSYLDPGSGGPENDFTNRNTTFMTWNLLHLARLINAAGGFPAYGNQRSEWEAGCRFDHPVPEFR